MFLVQSTDEAELLIKNIQQTTLNGKKLTKSKKLIDDLEKNPNKKNKRSVWEEVTAFYSRSGNFEHKHRRQAEIEVEESLRKKNKTFTKEEITKKVDILCREFEDLKVENSIDASLTTLMKGHPGFIINGLRCRRKTFDYLRAIVGDVMPNCKCEAGLMEHKETCFNMENDIMMFHQLPNGLRVTLVEVKRPTSKVPNSKLLLNGFDQLLRAQRLVKIILPDIAVEKLEFRMFVAVPETDMSKHLDGCSQCEQHFIDKNDLQSIELLEKKLQLNIESGQSASEELKIAASRLLRFLHVVDNKQYEVIVKYENEI